MSSTLTIGCTFQFLYFFSKNETEFVGILTTVLSIRLSSQFVMSIVASFIEFLKDRWVENFKFLSPEYHLLFADLVAKFDSINTLTMCDENFSQNHICFVSHVLFVCEYIVLEVVLNLFSLRERIALEVNVLSNGLIATKISMKNIIFTIFPFHKTKL